MSKSPPPTAQYLRDLAFAKLQEYIVLAQKARDTQIEYHELTRKAQAAAFAENLAKIAKRGGR